VVRRQSRGDVGGHARSQFQCLRLRDCLEKTAVSAASRATVVVAARQSIVALRRAGEYQTRSVLNGNVGTSRKVQRGEPRTVGGGRTIQQCI